MTDPLGPVVITAREIYDQLVRMTTAIERLVGQHDALARDQQDHEREASVKHQDHEDRIRALERARWPLPSLAALVALAALLLPLLRG